MRRQKKIFYEEKTQLKLLKLILGMRRNYKRTYHDYSLNPQNKRTTIDLEHRFCNFCCKNSSLISLCVCVYCLNQKNIISRYCHHCGFRKWDNNYVCCGKCIVEEYKHEEDLNNLPM